VKIIRRTLFEKQTLQIGSFEAQPVSDACGEVERQSANVVVLPVSGVFSKHDAPGRHVVGTPSQAVFVAADTPYRIASPAPSAIVRSRCGSARPWRPTTAIVTAAASRSHRTGCFRPTR
jgi:hypothetical protein